MNISEPSVRYVTQPAGVNLRMALSQARTKRLMRLDLPFCARGEHPGGQVVSAVLVQVAKDHAVNDKPTAREIFLKELLNLGGNAICSVPPRMLSRSLQQ